MEYFVCLFYVYSLEWVWETWVQPFCYLECVCVENYYLEVGWSEVEISSHEVEVVVGGGERELWVEPRLF